MFRLKDSYGLVTKRVLCVFCFRIKHTAMANPDAFDEQRVGDATPEPNPASRVVGEGGADPGDAMPEPNPASRVVGDGGAEPVVPNVSLTMFAEWCRISNCFRRGELVYIQIRDSVVHGFTLNERNDLNYFWERPNGVTAYMPFPLPFRLVISPERGDEHGSCKLINGDDSTLGLDDEFIAKLMRFAHLRAEEEPPSAPVQMTVDPLDENIAANQVQLDLPATEEEEESIAPSAPASSTTTPEPLDEEEEEAEEDPRYWDAIYDEYRIGNQLWLMTYGGGPSGGYIIDYASTPRAISRWHRRGSRADEITPLPDGVRLLFTLRPEETPEAHVQEFTVERIESMNLHELDYSYAAAWYEDIWEDFPGESPAPPPNVPEDFGIQPYEGPNWQDEGAIGTISNTEHRCLSTNCPFCQRDFTIGEFVAKVSVRACRMHRVLRQRTPPRMVPLHTLP